MSLLAAAAVGAGAVWYVLKGKLEAPGQVETATAAATPPTETAVVQTQVGNAEPASGVGSPGEVRLAERVIGGQALLVADGETVVTEGYEPSPGEFVFSSLTPTLKTMEDGTTGVRLETKGFKITVSGDVDAEFEQKSAHAVDVKPGGAVTLVTMTGDGLYNLTATVNLDDLPLIRLQATGARMGPAPAAEP